MERNTEILRGQTETISWKIRVRSNDSRPHIVKMEPLNKTLSLAECIRQKRSQRGKNSGETIEILAKPSQVEIHRQPEHVTAETIPRYQVGDPKSRQYFVENGFVVVREVASEIEVEHAKNLFWEFAELKAGLRKGDPSTWVDSNFRRIGSTLTGILAGGGFGQSEFMWYLRTLPTVATSFNILYDRDTTDQLISSFDGGVMFRPWQHPDLVSACTQSGWYHVDQGRSLRGLQCIQGVLTLTDCNESTGGLCLIPKSHLHHDELVDSLPTRVDGNFVPVPAPFHVLKHPQILPRCQAGDMIFWDSRLIHCSTHSLSIPSSEDIGHFHIATATMDLETPLRLAAYISMTPREWASEDTISTRVEAFCRNMTTSHWSHLLTYAIPSHPYQGERKEIQEAKEEVRKLVGLSE